MIEKQYMRDIYKTQNTLQQKGSCFVSKLKTKLYELFQSDIRVT